MPGVFDSIRLLFSSKTKILVLISSFPIGIDSSSSKLRSTVKCVHEIVASVGPYKFEYLEVGKCFCMYFKVLIGIGSPQNKKCSMFRPEAFSKALVLAK